MKTTLKTSVLLLAVAAAAVKASAGDVYNDLFQYSSSGYVFPLLNGQPVGQQVYLNNQQLAVYPYLTNFTFAYSSTDTSAYAGNVQLDVQFFKNDGPTTNGYASPGTLFYQTGWFQVDPPLYLFGGSTNTAYGHIGSLGTEDDLYNPANPDIALAQGVALPSSFTVVFTVTNLVGTDNLSLPLFNPSAAGVVGTNYGSYWQDNGGNWSLVTNNATPVSFGIQLETTPEPSVIGMGAVGALLLARLARKR